MARKSPLYALATLIGACQAPVQPAAPAASESWEQFQRNRPDRFIEGYEAEIAKIRAALGTAGLGDEWTAVRAYVNAYLPAGDYTLQATGANAAVLRRLRVDSTTNYMVDLGYRRIHFATPEQARLLVSAAAGTVGGPTGEHDLARFAPTVARAAHERIETASDGARTLVVRVTEALKNSPPPGALIRFTLDPVPAGPYPPPPNPAGEEFARTREMVLFLSPPRARAGTARVDRFTRFTAPMAVDGERVVPGYHSMAPETTLTSLREGIRTQVCVPGFVPVAGGGGRSLDC